MAERKATPVLAAMASLVMALIVGAIYHETHDWEAVLFVVIAVGLVVVTTVWAVKTILREDEKQ